MRRVWLIVIWFVLLFVWNFYPLWSITSPGDMSETCRLAVIALHKATSLTGIVLSITVIVLVFTVKFQPRLPY